MDLLVSSFVSHSSLLTAKCIDLLVAGDGFLCQMEIIHFFIVAGAYKQLLLCNKLSATDKEA